MPHDLLVPVISTLSFDSDADDGVVYEWSCLSSSTTNDGQELMFVNRDVSREKTFAPSSKPGSTSMYGIASKAGSASMYDATPTAEKCSNFEATLFGFTPKTDSASMFGSPPKADAANRHDTTTTVDKNSMFEASPMADAASSYGRTPSADRYSMFEKTPKAGAANRYGAKTTADKYAMSTFDNDLTYAANSTPSWDIDNTFSFRKKDETNGETRYNQQKIQSYSGIRGLFSMNRLSPSMSGSMKDDEDDKSSENHLAESVENDLFAMDVGLML